MFVRRFITSILIAGVLMAQEPGDSTFRAETSTVLVPFNVQRGKYFAADLQPSDFVLLEDGHPRPFTVFEGPNTKHPLPLELILLFDTAKSAPKNHIGPFNAVWDVKADYEFLKNWDESTTRTVLQQNGMDISMSVYHFDDGHFERLCRASRDPQEIGEAFRKLLSPIPAQDRLTLLPGNHVNEGGWIAVSRGWWQEATVAALRDAASSPVPARRVLFVFSGLDNGGTAPGRGAGSWPAIGNEAIRLGIAIDPVVMDFYKWAASQHITGDNPHVGLFSVPVTMRDGSTRYVGAPMSGRLGEMTGGEALLPDHLTRDTLADILQLIRNKTLSRYLVGFVPETAGQPGKHRLQVELKSAAAGKILGGERQDVAY